MDASDFQQQVESEMERYETTLDALILVWERGLPSTAMLLAKELSMGAALQREINRRI